MQAASIPARVMYCMYEPEYDDSNVRADRGIGSVNHSRNMPHIASKW